MAEALTFNLFFDNFGRIQPVRDVEGVSVLKAEVVLFDDVQVVVNLLHQILTNRFFLERKKNSQIRKFFYNIRCLNESLSRAIKVSRLDFNYQILKLAISGLS